MNEKILGLLPIQGLYYRVPASPKNRVYLLILLVFLHKTVFILTTTTMTIAEMESEFPAAPYYAKDHPGVLPAASEIMRVYKTLERREETSKEIAELHLGEGDDAQDSNQPVVRMRRGVYRFGKHFIVKVGGTRTSLIQERQNILFVRQATRIPVAAVYAFFRDEGSDLEILVEEYIPGENLVAAWERLDQQGKDVMLITLRGYLDDLRQIPSPGYLGSPWRQPIIEPHIVEGLIPPLSVTIPGRARPKSSGLNC